MGPDDNGGDEDNALSCGGDCEDSVFGAHPGGTEVCNGYDDDCDGTVGYVATCETLTDVSSGSGTNRMRGNVLRADKNTVLLQFSQKVNGTAGDTLTWGVYESQSTSGPWTEVFEGSTSAVTSDPAYHDSPQMNVPLTTGLYYALGVHWTANSGYYWVSSAPDTDTSWGAHVNAYTYNSSSPPSSSPSFGTNSNQYAMTVTTRDEECFSDDFEAGQLSQAWTLLGDADWYVQSTSVSSGDYSVKSGPIAGNEYTTLRVDTQIPAGSLICFDWFGNSQYQGDYLEVWAGNNMLIRISGLWNPWGRHCYNGGPATRLNFVYDKNASIEVGADAFWIDDIVITP